MEHEYNGIWVYASHDGKNLTKPTLELLAKGRQLADKSNLKLSAVLLGYNIEPLIHNLIRYGADKVFIVDEEPLQSYSTIPYTQVLTELIQKEKPAILLFVADTTGRDLAPRLATRLETGLTADCTELDVGDYYDSKSGKRYARVLYQIRPAFRGDVMATIVTPERFPQMATVRHGIFEPLNKDYTRNGEIVRRSIDLNGSDLLVEVLDRIQKAKKTRLDDTAIIVGGGRGIGGFEGFKLIRRLATLLGAEVGATRAAVDAGWISYDHQIGLTGQTVRPALYIACGISGAIQHLVGVKHAQTIVAINNDPKTPIFDFADYGIVGDVFEVLPKFIEKLEQWIQRGKFP